MALEGSCTRRKTTGLDGRSQQDNPCTLEANMQGEQVKLKCLPHTFLGCLRDKQQRIQIREGVL